MTSLLSVSTPALRTLALLAAGTMALAVSAKLQVPSWPVPMTMQSLVVLLIGLLYGSRLGLATLLAYLAEGAAGLPVFAGPLAGPAVLAGPTGGYLLGFAAAAWVAGRLGERGWARTLPGAAAVMLLGHAVILLPGIAWLATSIGTQHAVTLGLVPFLAGTLVKSGLGTALVAVTRSVRARTPR